MGYIFKQLQKEHITKNQYFLNILMMIIQHKFLDNQIEPNTEILIVGTFNPNIDGNIAEYFYGRERNYLWRILSKCYNVDDLKDRKTEEKIYFAKIRKIAFIDLIRSVEFNGEKIGYDDKILDPIVAEWNQVSELIQTLKSLQKVAFTRKTFNDVPNIEREWRKVQQTCLENNVKCASLVSPARYFSENKAVEWKNFLVD